MFSSSDVVITASIRLSTEELYSLALCSGNRDARKSVEWDDLRGGGCEYESIAKSLEGELTSSSCTEQGTARREDLIAVIER